MDAPLPSTASVRLSRWAGTPAGENTLAAAFLFALTLAIFAGVLFGPGDVVLSNADADLAKQFIHWRAFGFHELRAGRLALWNPHIYSGAPYFGGFQSALLYPPNWLYLCLPLGRAINVGIALHVFLAGWFMFLWTRGRGLHPLACVFAGVLFMFSGPYFPHIYAGHLPNLCTMIWAPLLFLAIDDWLERRGTGSVLLGAGAVAMQILAGHPQYVFYTGVAAAVYCAMELCVTRRRVTAAAGLAAMAAGGFGLSAVQLFEGFHAAGESVRSVGITMDFAAIFSFPPENLLTLVVPGFFGDMTGYEYWGRGYLWEMSLFFGISGLVMSIYGACRGDGAKRRFSAVMVALLLVLAFGAYTPLFKWLYLYAPGFNKFRGWSKFTFPAMLFMVMLAGVGFDRILRREDAGRRVGLIALTAGIVLLGVSAWAFTSIHATGVSGPRPWGHWQRLLGLTGEQLVDQAKLQKPDFVVGAARFAAWQLLTASLVTLALSGGLLAIRKYPRARWAMVALAVAEMVTFARSSFDTLLLSDFTHTPITEFLRDKPGDYRILNQENANLAMTIGARDLWGYDPGVLRRYAEWMYSAQGWDPNGASQELSFDHLPPIYDSLLRCRYILKLKADEHGDESLGVITMPVLTAGPRVSLISDVRVMRRRDDIFAAMKEPTFDARHRVILETPPDPAPVPDGPAGTARVIAETTDSLTVDADLPAAAVLLVTDTYCSGWRARSLLRPGRDPQSHYDVVPADYCLRAVPLAAGHHRIVLEYWPRAFVVGMWTSVATLCVYLAACIRHAVRQRGGLNGSVTSGERPPDPEVATEA